MAPDQSSIIPPPRQPAFNPEVENGDDILPSYNDAVTDRDVDR